MQEGEEEELLPLHGGLPEMPEDLRCVHAAAQTVQGQNEHNAVPREETLEPVHVQKSLEEVQEDLREVRLSCGL